MTAEASFIVPMALCLVVFVLYLAFYMYDRCAVEQDAYIHAYQKSIERGHTQHREGDLSESRRSTFLLASFSEKLETGLTVRCRVRAELAATVFRGYFLMPEGWGIDTAQQARKSDPPHSFRRARRIAALLRMAQED